ncbi:protein tonsoku [Phtheirospermum japonicum]|uniref:Protein tonsoku n=1 Tax=Phtheirospermum japonicum TaxID=374723 RepID=A0A830BCP9_9LAMI|nr:protein tonsoku [Phtheirospermum japonicum]
MRRKEEASQQQQLSAAKRAYKASAAEGNRQEEARWANVVGDILKNRGEYVEALRWLRMDYDVSVRYLPDKQLLATCQSLGEVYLRLHEYNNALIYQKKHLELAKDENDLIEQQRASTQLGRAYHEMFLKSDDDHCAVRNAKKYFKLAMKLAQAIKENPPCARDSYLKEYIDAHNNLGMLEIDLDNLDEAEKILRRGLEICDEEEVIEDDDTRSRLHHNLGNVYLELRKWENAKEHIRKDILICKRIGHCQGEAKGYVNLGELYYRIQKYNEAISAYQKALELANSLEDERSLANQIKQNAETVKEAMKVMSELKKEEQNLKKLERNTQMARGTENERKCLLKQYASVDCLVEKSRMISLWIKVREFAKKKKRLARELCDKEKLGDSFLVVGESYQKLRKFSKALKWFQKGWETYRVIGNLEGQALAKINIGDVLDSSGDWAGALDAFQKGHRQIEFCPKIYLILAENVVLLDRIAVDGNLSSLQLSALENIHYSHMIRFDDAEEARRTRLLIDKLKQSKNGELEPEECLRDLCSETETELDNQSTDDRSDGSFSLKEYKLNPLRVKSSDLDDEMNDNVPLISLLQSNKNTAKRTTVCGIAPNATSKSCESHTRSISRSTGSCTVNRKRVRVILSDDEGEKEDCCSERMVRKCPVEGIATSDELTRKYASSQVNEDQDFSPVTSRCTVVASARANLENSIWSYKPTSSKLGLQNAKDFRDTGTCEADGNSNTHGNDNSVYIGGDVDYLAVRLKHIIFKIDQEFVHMDLDLCRVGGKLDLEQIKVELACLYYLQLPREKRSRGLVPVIQHMKYGGRVIESIETLFSLRDAPGESWVEVSIGVMVAKHVMKLYIDCCEKLSEPPNLDVVWKLYKLEVSEDEIVVSDCQLRDVSVAPLLNALQLHKTLAVLDLSHNLLGNETIAKLKQVFISSGQNYGGLVLNLHNNELGPAALFQICECPVLYARLEVLNISGNSLEDKCASYLSTILRTCKGETSRLVDHFVIPMFSISQHLCCFVKAFYLKGNHGEIQILNIENCSITSRTIQVVADSLDSGSVLTHLCIGRNNPVSGNALINLLLKLTSLHRFQELNLNGIKLSKPVVNSLCQLANNCCLSGLLLGNTNIGTEGAIQLIKPLSKDTQELVRLDLSFCGLTSDYIVRLRDEASLISGILELDLGGNPIMTEGCSQLASLLSNPQCCLRVLVVCKCEFGLVGVIHILQALSKNHSLEELNLAENVGPNEIQALTDSLGSVGDSSNSSQKGINRPDSSASPQEMCAINTDENQLEVADSEDNLVEVEAALDSQICTSQKRVVLSECQSMQQLSASVKAAGNVKRLDLSGNGFSQEVIDMLFSAWRSGSRAVVAQRHVDETTVHFSVEGNKCCGVKPCCRKI